ncbi:transposase [Streptomyces bobili]|uniref:transposase n=1 Tax=Streptomyces bobili TaxID=67280 RepID=UPI0036F039E9
MPHLRPRQGPAHPGPRLTLLIICALEPGRSSWTAPLDAPRLTPGDDTATVPSRLLRDLLQRLIAAGQWQTGDPDILIVAAAGYDAPCLGFLLKDLPVQVLARMRSDRVLRRPVPAWLPHTPRAGRPGTAASSPLDSPTPGTLRTPSPTPASTAPPQPAPLLGPAAPRTDPPLLTGNRRRHPPSSSKGR